MSLGPLLGIAIVKHANYQAMFYSGMGIGLAGLLLACFVLPPHIVSRKQFKWSGLIEPVTVPVSMVQLILNLAYGGLLSYVAMFGKQIGVGNPGQFFLFFAIGMGLSRLWSGKVFDRKGPTLLLRSGFALLVAGFVLLAASKNSLLYLLAAFVIGTGNGITMPTFQAMINAVVPGERRGAANSTFFASFDVGIGLGMVLTGRLADTAGLRVSYLACGGVVLCAIILFEVFALRHYTNSPKQST
jgi:predicted MFS family arabinose efflux permease